MASPEWLEIYATYSDAELVAEVAALKRQNSIFSSQTVGSKSFTRDLQELKNKLSSAIRVQTERGQSANNKNWSVTDFSRIRDDADR